MITSLLPGCTTSLNFNPFATTKKKTTSEEELEQNLMAASRVVIVDEANFEGGIHEDNLKGRDNVK
eukprot:gene314-33548_t